MGDPGDKNSLPIRLQFKIELVVHGALFILPQLKREDFISKNQLFFRGQINSLGEWLKSVRSLEVVGFTIFTFLVLMRNELP